MMRENEWGWPMMRDTNHKPDPADGWEMVAECILRIPLDQRAEAVCPYTEIHGEPTFSVSRWADQPPDGLLEEE